MRSLRRAGDHRGALAAVVTAALAVTGAGVLYAGTRDTGGPPQPVQSLSAEPSAPAAAAPTPPAGSPSATSGRSAATAQPVLDFGPSMSPSPPVRLRIPAIGVDARGLVDLKLGAQGELEAPKDFGRAGWYVGGPTPGEFGPSVIAAHVDSKAGPAVFYRLGQLKPGDKVDVTRADGSTATFAIDKVGRYSKARFPTSAVYGGSTLRAEVRLITCGGAFDRSTGHYVDNIVAFGHLISS